MVSSCHLSCVCFSHAGSAWNGKIHLETGLDLRLNRNHILNGCRTRFQEIYEKQDFRLRLVQLWTITLGAGGGHLRFTSVPKPESSADTLIVVRTYKKNRRRKIALPKLGNVCFHRCSAEIPSWNRADSCGHRRERALPHAVLLEFTKDSKELFERRPTSNFIDIEGCHQTRRSKGSERFPTCKKNILRPTA